MQLMTFNLRFANPQDGPNHWEYRKELVVDTILRCAPDLLATQEGTVPQLDYLARRLPDYRALTVHRRVDPTFQYPTIFFRHGVLEVRDSGDFHLSETPGVHRSKSWESAFPRIVTYGRFRLTGQGPWFFFINTHLDHVSASARLAGARLIARYFSQRREPLILAGDFNEPPAAPVHREFVGPHRLFLDTWQAVHASEEDAATQHHFDGHPRGSRIDWILVTPPFRVERAEIIRYNQGGRYPSDHFPYLAEVVY
ncbi:MAG: endonuclease/exonuclease/phosphatase family protein [Deltaproteobacteria bacterium]|nr:endonuclease/exonuclease/phosphatase family protein [Deltaproteobacteria bacterium]